MTSQAPKMGSAELHHSIKHVEYIFLKKSMTFPVWMWKSFLKTLGVRLRQFSEISAISKKIFHFWLPKMLLSYNFFSHGLLSKHNVHNAIRWPSRDLSGLNANISCAISIFLPQMKTWYLAFEKKNANPSGCFPHCQSLQNVFKAQNMPWLNQSSLGNICETPEIANHASSQFFVPVSGWLSYF